MLASEWLKAINRDLASGFVALSCFDAIERTWWLGHDELDRADETVEFCKTTQGANLYFRVCATKEKAGVGRGKEGDSAFFPGIWVDLDIAEHSGPKKTKKKYPPLSIAEQVLASLPLAPSVVVHSGGGLHPYWLLHELHHMDDGPARDRAKQIVLGWQSLVASKLRKIGGYDLDSTADLARVMRLVGSWNYRHARAADILPLYAGPDLWKRYELDDFEPFASTSTPPADITVPKYQVVGLILDPAARLPDRHEPLLENCPEYRHTWTHKRSFPSSSEYELSLANLAARALWNDQEIADMLIYHRRRWEPEKLSKLTDRPDYIAGTIAKVRGDKHRDFAIRSLNGELADQDESTEPGTDQPPAPRDDVLDKLSTIFGVRIIGWVQLGLERPIYTLVLDNGREVRIGSVPMILWSEKAFAEAVYAETGHKMKAVGKKAWHGVCEALAQIVEVVEAPEATEAQSVKYGIQAFLRKKEIFGPAQKDEAARISMPFLEDGHLYISVDPVRHWINMHLSENWKRPDFINAVRSLGFERLTMHFDGAGAGGQRSTRSYWRCKEILFHEEVAHCRKEPG